MKRNTIATLLAASMISSLLLAQYTSALEVVDSAAGAYDTYDVTYGSYDTNYGSVTDYTTDTDSTVTVTDTADDTASSYSYNAYNYYTYYAPAATDDDEPEAAEEEPAEEDETIEAVTPEPEEEKEEEIVDAAPSKWPTAPSIHAASALLIETRTGAVLYSKEPDDQVQPGSPVKILSALVALENGNLSDSYEATFTALGAVTLDSANMGMNAGETFTLEECLYASLLTSANDAALLAAEGVAGDVDHFVELMNKKAEELGCTNSHFTNPTGLPDEAMYTTAEDFAKIIYAAVQNEDFRRIASASEYVIPATVSTPERYLSNSFSLMNPNTMYYYEGTVCGKEGYTAESLSTVAAYAEKKDMQMVAVVMEGDEGLTSSDAQALFEYGFGCFSLTNGPHFFEARSGGQILMPTGATVADLQILDSPIDKGIAYTYMIGNHFVGAAEVEDATWTEEETEVEIKDTETARIENETHVREAENITLNKSDIPYYGIGAATLILFILLIIWIVRIIKK